MLADIRRLLREAVAEPSGHEVDSRGDELFAVFASPRAAAVAATDAQRRARRPQLAGGGVRVRIGLHTRHAALAEDGYVGVDVHRASRIASAGHGGQIVASETSAAALAPARELRDLGLWSLPDLPEPERIFQLDEPGLGGDFPPLRARPGATPVRVVLADDSVLLREGIARLLEDAGFEVVAQSGNAEDLLRHVAMHKPDVAIVDIRMPPTQTDEGLRAAKEIRERHPDTGVLVLSQYVEPAYAMELLSESAEGVGYLLKDRVADVEEFAAAVRRVAEGGSALDPAVVSELVGRHRRDDPLDDLSPREREVLELMAEGRSNQAIAERLFVTLRAVEKHVTSIFVKLRLPAAAEDHRRVLAVLALLARTDSEPASRGKDQGRLRVMPDIAAALARPRMPGSDRGQPARTTIPLATVRVAAPRDAGLPHRSGLAGLRGWRHVPRPHPPPRRPALPRPRSSSPPSPSSTAGTSSCAGSAPRTGRPLARTPPTSSRSSSASTSSSSSTSRTSPLRVPGVPALLGFLYVALHFAGTAAALTWVHRRHPHAFPFLRTTLIVSTALALVGYVLYPAAPPRLADLGFADTVTTHTGLNLSSDLLGSLYNPIAAVPSLHFGYSLIVGVAIAQLASRRWMRIAGAAYPALMLLVIVATGNHFLFDAVAGGLVVAAGWFVASRLRRAGPRPAPVRLARTHRHLDPAFHPPHAQAA